MTHSTALNQLHGLSGPTRLYLSRWKGFLVSSLVYLGFFLQLPLKILQLLGEDLLAFG